mgnify:CR=1 FL=1
MPACKVLEPIKEQVEADQQRLASQKKAYKCQAIFDGILLAFASCIFLLSFRDESGTCYATKDRDYPLNIDEVKELGLTDYVDITTRFNILLGIFVANFMFTLAVDLAKICVRFDT